MNDNDATAFVQPNMLTQLVTLNDYLTCHGQVELSKLSPDTQRRVAIRRSDVTKFLLPDDELWEWSHGQDFAAIGGLAIVRSDEIIRAWRDWKS
ncbi:MAG: hypothetical protein QM775_34470 [Pirellulales bacterium]